MPPRGDVSAKRKRQSNVRYENASVAKRARQTSGRRGASTSSASPIRMGERPGTSESGITAMSPSIIVPQMARRTGRLPPVKPIDDSDSSPERTRKPPSDTDKEVQVTGWRRGARQVEVEIPLRHRSSRRILAHMSSDDESLFRLSSDNWPDTSSSQSRSRRVQDDVGSDEEFFSVKSDIEDDDTLRRSPRRPRVKADNRQTNSARLRRIQRRLYKEEDSDENENWNDDKDDDDLDSRIAMAGPGPATKRQRRAASKRQSLRSVPQLSQSAFKPFLKGPEAPMQSEDIAPFSSPPRNSDEAEVHNRGGSGNSSRTQAETQGETLSRRTLRIIDGEEVWVARTDSEEGDEETDNAPSTSRRAKKPDSPSNVTPSMTLSRISAHEMDMLDDSALSALTEDSDSASEELYKCQWGQCTELLPSSSDLKRHLIMHAFIFERKKSSSPRSAASISHEVSAMEALEAQLATISELEARLQVAEARSESEAATALIKDRNRVEQLLAGAKVELKARDAAIAELELRLTELDQILDEAEFEPQVMALEAQLEERDEAIADLSLQLTSSRKKPKPSALQPRIKALMAQLKERDEAIVGLELRLTEAAAALEVQLKERSEAVAELELRLTEAENKLEPPSLQPQVTALEAQLKEREAKIVELERQLSARPADVSAPKQLSESDTIVGTDVPPATVGNDRDETVTDLKKRLKEAKSSLKSTKSDLAFFRENYETASTRAVEEVRRAQALEEKVTKLREQLTLGLKQRELHAAAVSDQNSAENQRLKMQLQFLLDQSRLTDDDVRRKAAAYNGLIKAKRQFEKDLREERAMVDELKKRNNVLAQRVVILRGHQMGAFDHPEDPETSNNIGKEAALNISSGAGALRSEVPGSTQAAAPVTDAVAENMGLLVASGGKPDEQALPVFVPLNVNSDFALARGDEGSDPSRGGIHAFRCKWALEGNVRCPDLFRTLVELHEHGIEHVRRSTGVYETS